MRSRREATVLVRIAIDCEVEEVGADPTIVKQRIAFARRSISTNHLAALFALDKEGKQFALSFVDLGSEFRVRDDIPEAYLLLVVQQFGYRRRSTVLGFLPGQVDPKGTTVCRQLFDIENSETVAPRKLIDRNQ